MADTDTVTENEESETVALEVTEAALEKVLEVRNAEDDPETLGLRVRIVGVSGPEFAYDLAFESLTDAEEGELVYEVGEGLKVMVPGDSIINLTGATLDYTTTQGLVIRNPNRPAAPDIEGLTRDDELSAEIETVISAEVNPARAAHGGFVTYVGHDGEGTAYLTMGGGCHGCSMSKMTMLDGVQTMLSEAIEGIEKVKDLTDHTTGENPFYS